MNLIFFLHVIICISVSTVFFLSGSYDYGFIILFMGLVITLMTWVRELGPLKQEL